MPNQTNRLIGSLLLATHLLAGVCHASEDERWFRVELLVFANTTPASPGPALTSEEWEATPTLAYPTASRFLIDPARVASNASEFGGESVLDEYGRQIIKLVSGEELAEDLALRQPAVDPDTPVDNPNSDAQAIAPPTRMTPVYQGEVPEGALIPEDTTSVPAELRLPEPFVILSADYLEFGERVNRMRAGDDYRVLFHQSWVQPVTASSNSLPIVLDHSGDEQFWPSLQGTIDIHLARYLEIKTNLWLNTQGQYLAGTWQMSAPPLGPPSLIVEEQGLIDGADIPGNLPDDSTSGVQPVDDAVEVYSGDGVIQTAYDIERSLENDELRSLNEVFDPNNPEAMAEGEAQPEYPYRHAVLLKQTRRMRSNEVHYIDHPILGVVVKFTPMDPEELDAIAEAQPPLAMVGQLE